jgi:hypothetical protein
MKQDYEDLKEAVKKLLNVVEEETGSSGNSTY